MANEKIDLTGHDVKQVAMLLRDYMKVMKDILFELRELRKELRRANGRKV